MDTKINSARNIRVIRIYMYRNFIESLRSHKVYCSGHKWTQRWRKWLCMKHVSNSLLKEKKEWWWVRYGGPVRLSRVFWDCISIEMLKNRTSRAGMDPWGLMSSAPGSTQSYPGEPVTVPKLERFLLKCLVGNNKLLFGRYGLLEMVMFYKGPYLIDWVLQDLEELANTRNL